MTSFQWLSHIFPENAITRAERAYQQSAAKTLPRWRWVNRIITVLVVAYALIQLGILLIASLTQTNPVPIASQLLLFSALLVIIIVYYHFYLMLQTISISADSIVREKLNQAGDMAGISGVNARQIVWGKWWVTVQGLLPRYLLLGILRVGATAAVGMGVAAMSFLSPYYNNGYVQLPHPITIMVASVLAIVLTVANLGFSAACGMMSSAISKRSARATVLGFAIQIIFSLVAAIILIFVFNRLLLVAIEPASRSIYSSISFAATSLASTSVIDNGYGLLSTPLYVSFVSKNVSNYSSIVPVNFDWIIAALLTLTFYIILIVFALWVAKRSLKRSLVTPSS